MRSECLFPTALLKLILQPKSSTKKLLLITLYSDVYILIKVCRAYLLECCPREILSDTRLESLMACRKLHEPSHKADYQKAQSQKDLFYDIEVTSR